MAMASGSPPGSAAARAAAEERALRGIGLEAPQNRAFDDGVEAAHVRGRTRRRRGRDSLQVLKTLDVEGALAREEFVQHKPERVEVGAFGERAARDLFRRHVLRRADARFVAGDPLGGAREPEVRDLGAAAAVDHDVGWFQVAV